MHNGHWKYKNRKIKLLINIDSHFKPQHSCHHHVAVAIDSPIFALKDYQPNLD